MEKLTKEELLENLGGTPLNDDELENVSGGFIPQAKPCGPDEIWSDELNKCVYVVH